VAQAQRLLDEAESTPTLGELGEAVGMSPFHLQRVFKRATGLSPREYAAARRTERLKAALRRGKDVTNALYDAGYGSSRALYARAQEHLGMSPATYRRGGAGQQIAYAIEDSPLGRLLVAATDKGICALRFGDDDTSLERELRTEFPQATLARDASAVRPYVRPVVDHLQGQHTQLELPLDVQASAFQQRVWAALRDIPYGQTRSYSQLAQMIGEPSAVRAVARACATNPVALVVPCHRVVRTGGALGGYRWGLERKRALLEREHRQAGQPTQPTQTALAL
jgi:AraC family transcriptional regulator of adaptative response/methylated-DNA-[protein]-cysteine methyltransferase